MSTSTISSGIMIFLGFIVLLVYGQPILVPLMFSILIYFLIRSIIKLLDRIPKVKKLIPAWVKSIVSGAIIFITIGLMSNMIAVNLEYLINSMPSFQGNINKIVIQINDWLGIDIIKIVLEKVNNIDYGKLANTLFNSVTSVLGNAMMVFFYVLFLVMEQSNFHHKLKVIFKGEDLKEVSSLLNEIEHSITQYIGLKTLISLLTGVVSYVVLFSFGIKSAFFWSFLIFIFNFIPYIGSLMAVLMPFFFSLIQFGEFTNPLIMLFILGSIQVVIGNFVEPLVMGDSLNISPLVTLISLAFWGYLWGLTGMFISVPLTVMLIIVLAKIPKTKPIAILLSHDGKI